MSRTPPISAYKSDLLLAYLDVLIEGQIQLLSVPQCQNGDKHGLIRAPFLLASLVQLLGIGLGQFKVGSG